MTDFSINDHLLAKECDDLATDIVDEVLADNPDDEPEDLRDTVDERVHETADGHEWVIMTYKAIQVAANCDCSDGEAFIEDVGLPNPITFGNLATAIVYGELRARIMAEAERLIEEKQEDYEDAENARLDAEEAEEAEEA